MIFRLLLFLAAILPAGRLHAEDGPAPSLLPAVFARETPPLRELAAGLPGPRRLAAGQHVEAPPSRLPDGTPTNQIMPTPAELAALPVRAPNTAVTVGTSGSRRLGTTGFGGIDTSTSDCGCTPPDQGLAVATITGQTFVVEANNISIQIFNGSGASLTGATPLNTFFSTSLNLSDPRVLFDASTQRWAISILAFSGDQTSSLELLFAISKTSDPTGSYFFYTVDASNRDLPFCGGAGCFPDQPHTGYDANGYYVTADLFPPSGANAQEIIYALPKRAMNSGMPITPIRFLTTDFVIMPSVPGASEPFVADNGGTEYMLTARQPVDGSSNIRVYAITNTSLIASSPANVKSSFVDVPAEAYPAAVPASQPNDNKCSFGSSSACSPLDGGRTSFTGEVVVSGGKLFGALPSGANDGNNLARDVVAWFAIQPNLKAKSFGATIFKQGFIVPPNGYSIDYPVFALRNAGQGVLALAITGTSAAAPGGYASAAVVPFQGFAPVGDIIVKGPGVDIDDDFSCPDQGSGSVSCRWGDYGAATVDPGTSRFWTANELTKFKRNFANPQWGTFLTQAH